MFGVSAAKSAAKKSTIVTGNKLVFTNVTHTFSSWLMYATTIFLASPLEICHYVFTMSMVSKFVLSYTSKGATTISLKMACLKSCSWNIRLMPRAPINYLSSEYNSNSLNLI